MASTVLMGLLDTQHALGGPPPRRVLAAAALAPIVALACASPAPVASSRAPMPGPAVGASSRLSDERVGLVAWPVGGDVPERCAGDREDAWCRALPPGAIGRLGRVGGAAGRVAVAPDGARWAMARQLGDVCLFDAKTGFLDDCLHPVPPASAEAHAAVVGLAFVDGGRRIAVATEAALLYVGVAKGDVLRAELGDAPTGRYASSASDVHRLAASRRGDRVVLGSCETESAAVVRVFDAEARRVRVLELPPLGADPLCVDALAVSADGKKIAASRRNLVLAWDDRGELLGQVSLHEGDIGALAFSPDGSELAIGDWGDAVNVVSTRTWRGTRSFGLLRGDGSSRARSVVYSHDGRWIAADAGHELRTWRVDDGARGASIDHAALLDFGPTGEVVALAGPGTPSITRFAVPSGERLAPVDASRHLDDVAGVAITADGARAATVGDDGLRIWDVPSGRPVAYFVGPPHVPLDRVAFLRDGSVAAASRDGRLHFVSIDRAETAPPSPLARVDEDGARDAIGLAASPTADVLAITLADGTLRRFDARARRELPPLRIGAGDGSARFTAPAWSRDGRTIAVGVGLEVWLVDAETGAVRQRVALLEHETVVAIDLAADRDELAILGDRRIAVVDVAGAPRLVRSIERMRPGDSGSVRFAGGGALALLDSTLELFDARTGRRLGARAARPARGSGLAAAGKRLVTAGEDGTSLVWDVEGSP